SKQFSPHLLRVADASHPELNRMTPVSMRKLDSQAQRAAVLFAFVTLGALLSVCLNVVFPFARDKAEAKRSLTTLNSTLADCTAADAAVRDAFSSEISRNRLILKDLWFNSLTKDSTMQDVRQAISRLASLVGMAREVSNRRCQTLASTLPTRLKLLLEAV